MGGLFPLAYILNCVKSLQNNFPSIVHSYYKNRGMYGPETPAMLEHQPGCCGIEEHHNHHHEHQQQIDGTMENGTVGGQAPRDTVVHLQKYGNSW